ncbi:SpoIID/LytB domain-containing protein [Limnochorda pilosa]|uniref:Stage II sporulation protein SpoIID n=1 Tax=Limnochorda pilosa TaxID=1555112 RepID=A0A0K2SQJ7_LIMPI|nr:SpoIID/LytB domain-containing protein [Limnochorda pilosa]BAS29400.1 stage II sporulation protein SpoIID [Limnochorda pilosa]
MAPAAGRRTWWVLGLVAAVLLAVLVWPRGEGRRLEEEPQVEVVGEDGRTARMGIEEYVAGVVAGEMRAGWPKEAYAAQALLARSFTLEYLNSHEGNRISTDFEEAQAFRPDQVTDVIRRAVEETRGKVLTYQGKVIRGWFHAYAGGETASAREGLAFQESEPPYIKTVRLASNPYVPDEYRQWSLTVPLEEVRRALAGLGQDVGAIRDLAARTGPTGRITQVEITTDRGPITVTGPDFRKALDPERMKSSKVTRFDVQGGSLQIEGTGFGHGVGLSQWDALMLAKEGKSPEEIVQTFFKDVEIEKRWR